MPVYNEKELLEQVARADESAFRQVYDTWHPKVYSLSMYLTRSAFMSEEITQEVFVKVWNNRHQLTSINYFNSWIRTIARNTILNYIKTKAREQLALQHYRGAMTDQTNETAEGIREREFAKLLHQIIDHLPAQQKKVWMLTRESGLTLAQAADEMGVSRHTAKEHLSRAVHTIRNKLDGHIEVMVLAAIPLFL